MTLAFALGISLLAPAPPPFFAVEGGTMAVFARQQDGALYGVTFEQGTLADSAQRVTTYDKTGRRLGSTRLVDAETLIGLSARDRLIVARGAQIYEVAGDRRLPMGARPDDAETLGYGDMLCHLLDGDTLRLERSGQVIARIAGVDWGDRVVYIPSVKRLVIVADPNQDGVVRTVDLATGREVSRALTTRSGAPVRLVFCESSIAALSSDEVVCFCELAGFSAGEIRRLPVLSDGTRRPEPGMETRRYGLCLLRPSTGVCRLLASVADAQWRTGDVFDPVRNRIAGRYRWGSVYVLNGERLYMVTATRPRPSRR